MEDKQSIGEYEEFTGQAICSGNSLAVTIPFRLVKFSGLQEGDSMRIMFRIIKKEGDLNGQVTDDSRD